MYADSHMCHAIHVWQSSVVHGMVPVLPSSDQELHQHGQQDVRIAAYMEGMWMDARRCEQILTMVCVVACTLGIATPAAAPTRATTVTAPAATASAPKAAASSTRGKVATPAAKPDDEDEGMIWDYEPRPAPTHTIRTITPAQPVSNVMPAKKNSTTSTAAPAKTRTPSSSSPPAASSPATTSKRVEAPHTTASQADANDGNIFGGPTMSTEFEKWCRAQLNKIAGSPGRETSDG